MAVRVDLRTTASLLGTVLKGLAWPFGVLALVALGYGESAVPFVVPLVPALVLGEGLERFERSDTGPREAFLLVALSWLSVALVGAIPFVLADTGVLATPVNALFESMSGITTTGATVIQSFDIHSRSILLWRSVLQWLGGLGILVLAVGLLSQLSVSGAQLMETETQTRNVTKLTPSIAGTARLLGGLYVGLTALLVLVLLALRIAGLAPNMGPYNAVAHALTTVSTAGFSPEPASVGAFSPSVQWVVILFMIVGATNFVLLYYLARGDPSRLRESEEFRFYLAVLAGATALIVAALAFEEGFSGLDTVRHAVFQAVSIFTTTGYATVDFDVWPPLARHVLLVGMFVGGMAGSTTCSIKTLRWLVVVKAFRRDLFTAIHPEAIRPIRLSGQPIDEGTIRDVYTYTLVSVVIFAFLTVFVIVDTARVGLALGEFEAMGAAASTFLNIGPAFGLAGPYGSYEAFPVSTKLVMIVLMWIGRIEIVPVLVLFTTAFWRS
ncbi:TrkH family potassium uptake protein [Halococcus saccharolyticus]|uniref:Trk-type transport system (Substrate potassium) 1, subunit 2.1 n=1 Tax=Halococcus saccharolyticus DSM 5350 TaxID=1227455 RepID=M0MFJ9_9EURY|nr:TrkH family potassium uptake protein [Halococcus saccharolyticus]EMA44143.1 Trk-type transport system (substrate potassium) 1, subunit 2.1 [Halococcus saccharolyticus DSM 5350]